jgi:phosphoglycerate kinase
MQSIKVLKNLKGKKVVLRVDFNVPIKNGKIIDDFRIKKSLPTIDFLLKKGAEIVLLTHLGKDGSESLFLVEKRFFNLSKFSKDRITFFENVRKYEGEEKNDKIFAKLLASMGNIYVNDAFSVSHRAHASVVGISKFLPSYSGFQLEEEISNLSKVMQSPKKPFLFVLGGAKFSTKLPLIKKYLNKADHIFIGGALFNDFLKASGFEIGKSLSSDFDLKTIQKISKNKKILLPLDVLVLDKNNKKINKKIEDIVKTDYVLDIGKESIKNLEDLVLKSKTILWNGPLGKYNDGGAEATKNILKTIAKTKVFSLIGGGDTVALISQMKMEKNFSFVSTGGGATLDFLANGTLPGIKALK